MVRLMGGHKGREAGKVERRGGVGGRILRTSEKAVVDAHEEDRVKGILGPRAGHQGRKMESRDLRVGSL